MTAAAAKVNFYVSDLNFLVLILLIHDVHWYYAFNNLSYRSSAYMYLLHTHARLRWSVLIRDCLMSDHLMLFNSYYRHILHYTVLYHTIEYCIKMNVHIILYYCSQSIHNVRTVNTFMPRFWYDYFAVVDFLYYVIYIAICCCHCNYYLKVISITIFRFNYHQI